MASSSVLRLPKDAFRHKTDVISAESETKNHPVRNVREAPGSVHRKQKKKGCQLI